MKSITVNGRRWFQKSYGNTYFTADILVDGELVHSIDRGYGYGDYYLQAAQEWLMENGLVETPRHDNGSYQPLWQYCGDNGINLHYSATDVARQRDL